MADPDYRKKQRAAERAMRMGILLHDSSKGPVEVGRNATKRMAKALGPNTRANLLRERRMRQRNEVDR